MMIDFHKNWLHRSYLVIKDKYNEIDNLDQQIGDGDHGSNILRGLDKVVNNFENIDINNEVDFMSEVSRLMRISMGGASGILMTIFIKEVANLNINNTQKSVLNIFSSTIEKIKKRGKVNIGDKSILDIYYPLHVKINNEDDFLIDEIFSSIDSSLQNTKNMEAKVGRAKFLDTKGVGVIDPGAFSTSIILKEFFREIFNEKNN